MPDAHANFATSLVATAPSPATSGTSLVVTTGEGARFPSVPFNMVIAPAGSDATSANAEIVRVTARSTDTLTITRAQESSSARTVIVGDRVYAGVTAKTLTDIESRLNPRYYRSTRYYTGLYQGTSGGLTLTQSTTYYVPIWIGKQQAFDQIAIGIVTAQTSSAVRLGIWDVVANGDWPGALLLDAGTVATTATGAKTITIASTLDAGLKFLGVNAQGGTAGVAVNRMVSAYDMPYGAPSTAITSGTSGVALTESGISGAFTTANVAPTESASQDLPRIFLRAA